ncbi:MAG: hypothetical protein JW959_13970 [Pirellulales bacterium]|nr:hypothetical protein [Pirellulales bacterium]
MRTNVARCLSAVLAATLLSGCSGGQWGMPNLAFWKRSPFQSQSIAAPSNVGAPARPSALAAASGTTAPAWTPPTETPAVAVTPGTEYPSQQNPYQPTTPSYGAGNDPAYTASTAGVPGVQAYGTPQPYGDPSPNTSYGGGEAYGAPTVPPVAPYDGANAYPSTSTAPSTPSYNNTSSGGYAPTAAPTESYNPVRSAATYPNAPSDAYGGNTAGGRYVAPPPTDGNPPPYDVGNGTGSYAPAAGSPYGTSPYKAPSSESGGYNPPTPYGGSRYENPAPNYSAPSGTDAASSGSRYSSPGGEAPLVGSRYSSPTAAPPATGSGGYMPPVPGYTPPIPDNSGYAAPSGATPAASPYSIPPANEAMPAYRPGSTSDYVPTASDAGN